MTVEIDPIFAAIEAHRHAQAAFEDAGVAELPCLPLEAAAGRAAWGLLTVLPTTPAGLLTFIDYAREIAARVTAPPVWELEFYSVVIRASAMIRDRFGGEWVEFDDCDLHATITESDS